MLSSDAILSHIPDILHRAVAKPRRLGSPKNRNTWDRQTTAPLAKLPQGESGVPANLVRTARVQCLPPPARSMLPCFVLSTKSSMPASIGISIKLSVSLGSPNRNARQQRHFFCRPLEHLPSATPLGEFRRLGQPSFEWSKTRIAVFQVDGSLGPGIRGLKGEIWSNTSTCSKLKLLVIFSIYWSVAALGGLGKLCG